ncbi:MAG: GNAT family N-acetyltransferase [Phycisphaerales bacterium]
MNPAHNPYQLPPNLPVPADDGRADHLLYAPPSDCQLLTSAGAPVRLRELCSGPTVLFFYPRTGVPGEPPDLGFQGEDWDSIPGARGCTPQSCAFRDLAREFTALGVGVFGVSTNPVAHIREFKARNHIPFELLSDSDLSLVRGMRLPTFNFPVRGEGPTTHICRMAWFVEDGIIKRLWYPVFPPDQNAPRVLAWLTLRAALAVRAARADDHAFVTEQLRAHWGGHDIWSRDARFDASKLPAFIAETNGAPAGLVTYHIGRDECEIVTLSSVSSGRGAGERLLHAVVGEAARAGCRRAFLTTSNDNLNAVRFYQRRGMRLVSIHPGAIDRARERTGCGPWVGASGIRSRDEWEFELLLT